MAVGNSLQHGMVAIEWRDGLCVYEERTLARALEGGVEFEVLVVDEEAHTVDESRCLGISDEHCVVDVNLAVGIHVAIFDVTGHHITVLTR